MNKKILAILALFLVAISVASVCAVELSKVNDFDGKFKMNSTDNSTFEKVVDGTGQNAYLSDQSWSDNKTAIVCYYNKDMSAVVSELKSNSGFMDNPKTEGNLTILEDNTAPEGASYSFKYMVGLSSPDKKTVMIASNDLNLAKEYANTITF